jgi:acetyl esterase/lipase
MVELVDVDVFLSPGLLAQWARWYAGEDLSRPLASPLYADLAGLPPLLVHAGDQEVLRDDTLRLVERAVAAGVEVEVEVWAEMCHHWHLFAGSAPEADEAVARMGAWIIARTP